MRHKKNQAGYPSIPAMSVTISVTLLYFPFCTRLAILINVGSFLRTSKSISSIKKASMDQHLFLTSRLRRYDSPHCQSLSPMSPMTGQNRAIFLYHSRPFKKRQRRV